MSVFRVSENSHQIYTNTKIETYHPKTEHQPHFHLQMSVNSVQIQHGAFVVQIIGVNSKQISLKFNGLF